VIAWLEEWAALMVPVLEKLMGIIEFAGDGVPQSAPP
jgi:hypothetical protein